MKRLFPLLLLLSHMVLGQRALTGIGEWYHHIPFNNGVRIAEVGEEIYCACKLGVFSYHKESGEITVYSKANGLSDVAISYMAYHEPLKLLFIAYENTNLDIIDMESLEITNYNDIYRKSIVGEKNIHHIMFKEDYAYLSTSFGVVVFDMKKKEVKETYNSLDADGGSLPVYASDIYHDTLFLATNVGVLAASAASTVNRLDFNNWTNVRPRSKGYLFVGVHDDQLWALRADSAQVETYNGNWTTDVSLNGTRSISFDEPYACFITGTDVIVRHEDGTIETITKPGGNAPLQLLVDADNTYWFSDGTRGLTRYIDGVHKTIVPSGPLNSSIFRVDYQAGNIYSMQGGYDVGTKKLQRNFVVDQLGDGEWFTLGYWSNALLDSATDVVQVLIDATGNVYYATNSIGLIKKSTDKTFMLYDESNSPLTSALTGTSGFIRVPGIAMDSEQRLWVTNHTVQQGSPSIFSLSGNTWESYNFPKIPDSRFPRQIYIDDTDTKWVILANGGTGNGVLVFNSEHPDGRHLKTGFEQGDLQDLKVNDIAFDKNGAVWMVGRAGVSVFQTPEAIFDGGELNDATKPIFEGRPLMENEYCTAIAIDEGNRKWIGTENGLFLMDEFGTTQLANYNTSNSPLPTNKINDLELNTETGELFIGTDLGLLSYRTNSSVAASPCKDSIRVFPNPVELAFDGEVGIFSVTNNAEIRITDSWGNLVYATTANGGSTSWNLKDYNGVDVTTGVYLIMANGQGRKASCTERLAVIR